MLFNLLIAALAIAFWSGLAVAALVGAVIRLTDWLENRRDARRIAQARNQLGVL